MKGKFFLYLILVVIIAIAVFLGVKSFTKDKDGKITEYIPQEEISEEQERQTLVTLYFQNKQNKDIMPEARLIDVKLLLENPYETLVKLLLEGPKSDKLQPVIPDGTKINGAKVLGNTAILDLSEDFIKNVNLGKENEEKIVNSIVNTLTELNEIDSVKILIDGKEGKAFKDKGIEFTENFIRNN